MNFSASLKRKAFKIALLVFITFIASYSNAATITTATNGNWSSATTWNISVTRPGTVSVTAGSTSVTGSALASFTSTLSVGSQILNTSNVVIGTVASIQSATSLTLVSGATATMTNAGWNSRGVGPGDAVTIGAAHAITVDGNYTCASITFTAANTANSITLNSGVTLTVTGLVTMTSPASNSRSSTINVNAGNMYVGSLTMSGSSSSRRSNINITTGYLEIQGTLTSTAVSGSVFTITSTGELNFKGTVSANITINPGTTSFIDYNGAAAQTVRPITYANLTLGGGGSKTTTSVTVNGILSIEGAATASAAITFGSSAGIFLNFSTARTISNNEWPATFSGTQGISIGGAGSTTLNAAKVLGASSPLTINSGATLNTGNFALDLGGNFSNSGTFNAGSSNINISGTATSQNIDGFTTTGTITLTKTAGIATFTGNVTSGPLTLNGTGGGLSCGINRTHTFTKFTRGPGTLYGGSSTINITDSAYLSTGSFVAETSTVRWISNETAQDISSVTYYNVEFGGSSIKTTYTFTTIQNNFTMSGTASTTASANLTIGGDFIIGDGNTYNTAAFNLTVTGTTTIGAGSGGTLAINNATPVITFGDLTLNAGGTLTNTVNDSYTITGNFTNNGNFNSGTGTITFSGTSKSFEGSTQTTFANLDISGSYTLNSNIIYTSTLSGAGSLTMGSTGVLHINSATNPSVTTFNTSTSGNTVNYNLAGAQSILAQNYHHLGLSNSGIKTFLGNTIISGNLSLNNTADLDASTFNITLKGNLTTSSGTSGLTFTNAKLILDGSSTQTITVQRTIGLRPKKLFISNSEKIISTSQVVISDTTNIASGSILNGASASVINFAGVMSGTGTLKFGSCASPSNASVTFSYNLGDVTLPNFEPTFNQLNILNFNMGSNTRFAYINSDVIVSNILYLFGGVATFSGNLYLDGDAPISNQGGKMNFNGGSLIFGNCVSTGTAVTIPNDIFSVAPTIKNLTINRTNGVTFGNQMISISDVLTMTSGNLTTNGNLTLLSTSTNTARVAPITNGSVISGNVTVNRFIPGGSNKRKWRLLSSPVNVSGSIALSQFIDDIFITAPAAAAGGFDVSPNNNASIRTYNEATSGASSLGWTNPTNITNTVTTGTGLEVFVRGSRSLANPFFNWTVPDNVTIDYIGTLNTGNITKSLTYTPSTGGATTADGFNLVGNPYASPINFDTTAGWTKTNIENKFWCYNPNSSNYGIYDAVAHTGTNGITRYIASGQAFFVRATSASSPSITFTENVKCKQSGNSYFRPSKVVSTYPMLRMTLESDSSEYDEAIILIDSINGSNLPTDDRDAAKFFNDALNIYTVTKDKSNLAINAINVPSINDTINVSVWSYDSSAISTKQHKIKFAESETIDPTIDIYLLDQFLNLSINVRSTNEYNFMITNDVNSYGNNRFKLLFNNLGNGVTEQAKNTDVILYPNPAQNNLFFKINNEGNSTLKYDILDMMGRTIESSEVDIQNTLGMINIDKLNSGNYIIRMTLGEKLIIKKFIKQ